MGTEMQAVTVMIVHRSSSVLTALVSWRIHTLFSVPATWHISSVSPVAGKVSLNKAMR